MVRGSGILLSLYIDLLSRHTSFLDPEAAYFGGCSMQIFFFSFPFKNAVTTSRCQSCHPFAAATDTISLIVVHLTTRAKVSQKSTPSLCLCNYSSFQARSWVSASFVQSIYFAEIAFLTGGNSTNFHIPFLCGALISASIVCFQLLGRAHKTMCINSLSSTNSNMLSS